MSNRRPVAIVAGASRGIGRAISLTLARNGFDLALIARSPETLTACAEECRQLGARVESLPFDLEHVAMIESLLQRINATFGTIDILVNSAGFGTFGPISSDRLDDLDTSLSLNLRSIIHLTTRALPYIKRSSSGAIVQIASRAGRVTRPGLSAYCASKHGLMGFSGSLFEEIRGLGIKVSSICPGPVDTDMIASRNIDPKFMLHPDDVAAAVLFVLQFNSRGCPTEITLVPQREA